jgi:hypothetical protein
MQEKHPAIKSEKKENKKSIDRDMENGGSKDPLK